MLEVVMVYANLRILIFCLSRFGTNQDESLKFSVEKDVVSLFVNFIKENI